MCLAHGSWGLGLCLLVAFFVLASAAHADTVKLTGTVTSITLTVSDADAGYTNVKAIIDPYTGTLDGHSVLLWCVDPDHMSNLGDSWTANVTNLGALDLSKTYLNNPTAYGEMAWLVTQLHGASTTAAKQEYQAAIWEIAEGAPGSTGDFSVTAPSGDTNFAINVGNDITDASHHVLTSGFEILTDAAGKEQEFLVMTPEPSTLLLFMVGLIGLAVFASKQGPTTAREI
jgi:hypothetical protein